MFVEVFAQVVDHAAAPILAVVWLLTAVVSGRERAALEKNASCGDLLKGRSPSLV
jgi:hypothetical protein